ncbi:uncharacterized protein LOC117090777 [Trachypithecus francoisi]|uniref:uncharacterized protein LOC117090777 n=1 Tax=Trachypithecus francoisi TaxID=54180 RepID=UPI00141A7461|nr:uncharacterized protein LOC117090777 [Trachypithecus francoisi]
MQTAVREKGYKEGALVGGGVETPGPAPFRQAASQLPPHSLRASREREKHLVSLPWRSHRPRRLRSRRYRQLNRHMQLVSPARAARKPVRQQRSRETMSLYRETPTALGECREKPEDGGGEKLGSMRLALQDRGVAKRPRGGPPVGGASHPLERMNPRDRRAEKNATWKRRECTDSRMWPPHLRPFLNKRGDPPTQESQHHTSERRKDLVPTKACLIPIIIASMY